MRAALPLVIGLALGCTPPAVGDGGDSGRIDTIDSGTSPSGDADEDGIDNASDNCVDDANPNQLDIDGDGQGNVCDPWILGSVSGSLATTADGDAGMAGSCRVPITLTTSTGGLEVRFDDEGTAAVIGLGALRFRDVSDLGCDINQAVTLSADLSEPALLPRGTASSTFAMSTEDHDAGVAGGALSSAFGVRFDTALTIGAVGQSGPEVPVSTDLDLGPVEIAIDIDAGTLAMTVDDTVPLVAEGFALTNPVAVSGSFEVRGLSGTLVYQAK